MPKSFKFDVLAVGETEWVSNACRYATLDEAQDAGAELYSRRMDMKEWRAVPAEGAVNYVFQNGRSISLASMKAQAAADQKFFAGTAKQVENESQSLNIELSANKKNAHR